jgi:hypothetical protein
MIVLIEESQGIFNTITCHPNYLKLSPVNHEPQDYSKLIGRKTRKPETIETLGSPSVVQIDYEKFLSGSDKTG